MTNSLQKASSGLSIAEVAAILRDVIGVPARSVERSGAGAWSECFGFELDDKALVVRFGTGDGNAN